MELPPRKPLPLIAFLLGLALLSSNLGQARAGDLFHRKGQLIAVPMQGQVAASSAPQMGYYQVPQMSYYQVPQMSFTQQPQMSFTQQPQMSFSQSSGVPNVNITLNDPGSQPAAAAGVSSTPTTTPVVNIFLNDAPSQTPAPAAGVPSTTVTRQAGVPQAQASYSSGYAVPAGLPANAIPMQLYLAPKSHRSHHLYEKHHSIYVLRP
jgi:hypothetical protein